MLTKTASGAKAEASAWQYLKKQGLSLIVRNYRSRFGEIDIIAREQDILVFAEVRLRTPRGYASALESVDIYKQRRIISTAQCFLAEKGWAERFICRFDVLAVTPAAQTHKIEWIRGAFQC